MERVSSDENVSSSNIHLQKRQQSTEDKTRSAIVDFDVLDCPICVEPFTIPIFQCENGHLACSSCCPKLSNKCPSCALPLGHSRCRAMESVLESIFVPCPNAKFGCTKNVTYGKESTHEKECSFSQCSCPAFNCSYTCSYKSLYCHCRFTHTKRLNGSVMFRYGDSFSFRINVSDKILLITAAWDHTMFSVQCFRESYGVYVTVSCIAPNAPEIGEFSCLLSYTTFFDGHIVTYQIPKVKKVLKVSSQIPQENVMLIPHNLLPGEMFDMKVCIKELNRTQGQEM